MRLKLLHVCLLACVQFAIGDPSPHQDDRWLRQYPDADANGDGLLTVDEAKAYRQKLQGKENRRRKGVQQGAPWKFAVDPGWEVDRFPDNALCYWSPEEIKAVYAKILGGEANPVESYEKPSDGGLRIVGTGHSFMKPGYRTFPIICRAAGFEQPLLTHTGGGITGSARYKWEQENGIFMFDGSPKPKLLASIANAEWDAMLWGPYFNDRPAYYACWIDFCLKYNPHMKFYLADAWPQLDQLDEIPKSEDVLTAETIVRLGKQTHRLYAKILRELNTQYPNKVFVLPTCDAMVLAAQYYHRGELPGIEGIHRALGGKERSLWRDQIGHLGPGLDRLEGYVFYATIYGKSPELITEDIAFGGSPSFPSRELDGIFRHIAWQAVVCNPMSGVTDRDGNGIGDGRE